MKRKILVLALSLLFMVPCILHAEEVEIQLFEVIGMSVLPGDNPMDDPIQSGTEPPRPTNFRATIDGHFLSVSIRDYSVPSARLRVTKQSNNNIVVNETFSDTIETWVAPTDSYSIEIETDGGSLVGQFVVQ